MVKNPPANAGDMGSLPGLGGFHMPRTTKPVYPKVHALQQEKSLQREARMPQLENSPHWLQLEKAQAQQWRPSAVKNREIKIKKKKNLLI